MDVMLEEIVDLLYEIRKLSVSMWEMSRDEYKCEHWESYEDEFNKVVQDLNYTKVLVVDKINEFLDYPVKKFLFIKYTKKAKIHYNSLWEADALSIPFIDNKEYYCLITVLRSCTEVLYDSFSKGEFLFI